jgi:15-cis-phytoene synthase
MTESQAITQSSRSNLALAFIVLSKDRRHDISDFYAFCRVVDDIADGHASREEKARDLNRWRSALQAPIPDEPSLAPVIRQLIAKYTLPVAHFHEIIAGVEMDLDHSTYETWDDLRRYCHRVASVVGLVSIEIFGARDPAAQDYALNLGLALQITNILRDVGQDLTEYGRIYLPQEELRKFGVTREDLLAGRRTPAFLELMEFTARRADSYYAAAVLPPGDRRALAAAEIMRDVYARLLVKMRRGQWHVFGHRYRLHKFTKLAAIFRGWWRSL